MKRSAQCSSDQCWGGQCWGGQRLHGQCLHDLLHLHSSHLHLLQLVATLEDLSLVLGSIGPLSGNAKPQPVGFPNRQLATPAALPVASWLPAPACCDSQPPSNHAHGHSSLLLFLTSVSHDAATPLHLRQLSFRGSPADLLSRSIAIQQLRHVAEPQSKLSSPMNPKLLPASLWRFAALVFSMPLLAAANATQNLLDLVLFPPEPDKLLQPVFLGLPGPVPDGQAPCTERLPHHEGA
mmetsp:Transcript_40632/g.63826  ORF Transcript_40632/g.63826 Transcript_40632/m.63826 type:complete len:237 (-) Transcript_40632:64-774(-)